LTDVDIPKAYLAPRFKNTNTTDNPLTVTPIKYAAQYAVTTNSSNGTVARGVTAILYCSPLVGCTQPSLEYDQENNIFQFAYTHTPILELPQAGSAAAQESSSVPIEVVKMSKTINLEFNNPATPLIHSGGQVNIAPHTRHSGIIFQSMEPRSFWEQILGFDVSGITFSASEIWGKLRSMTIAQFNKATTSGFVGLEAGNLNLNNNSSNDKGYQNLSNLNSPAYTSAFPLNNNTSTTPGDQTYTYLLNSNRWFLEDYICRNPSQFQPIVPQTTNDFPFSGLFNNYYEEYASQSIATIPLQAIQPGISNLSNTGHYLIQIVGYGRSKDFLNTTTVYQIKGIISEYYSSANSYLTLPFADSFTYQHIGESQTIYRWEVSILDPLTMLPATTLGPSSSIYLQVNRQLNKLSFPQPDP
jgi:hypothetical protein